MKLRAFLVAACVVTFTGCASHQLNSWNAENKPLAEQGKIKWSEYYTQLYKQAESSSVRNKIEILERANLMIYASHEYESGRMPKEQFDYFNRLSNVMEQRENDTESARTRQIWANAMQGVGNSYKANAEMYQQRANQPIYRQPVQTQCNSYGNQINCTSQ